MLEASELVLEGTAGDRAAEVEEKLVEEELEAGRMPKGLGALTRSAAATSAWSKPTPAPLTLLIALCPWEVDCGKAWRSAW